MAMKPTIKLMPDYGCWPLWSGYDCIDPRDLPLTHETAQRLMQWAAIFDSILNHDDPKESVWPSEEAYNAFYQEGFHLWLQLRDELAESHTVWYQEGGDLFQQPSQHPFWQC